MLAYFLSVPDPSEALRTRKALFRGLLIENHRETFETCFAQFPVIYIDFSVSEHRGQSRFLRKHCVDTVVMFVMLEYSYRRNRYLGLDV
jgi:hypothetical protein